MFEQWKVLHIDDVAAESVLFCRALTEVQFAGHCESVTSFAEGTAYLERSQFTPQNLSRPDILIINWHPDCNLEVLDFVHWVRMQPQFREMPVIVFITSQLSHVDRERAQHEGVTELIVRADTFELLVEQVKDLLQRCTSRVTAR
jgi:CheY-like chemotaxis protein